MSTHHTYKHDTAERLGVLLVNLGTPDSPSKADVRRYLKEFLWDPRVVEVPRLAWWLVLNGVILNTRPKRSAEAYAKVWTDEGSPLLAISERQHKALQAALENRFKLPVKVALGMRYGNPSIAHAMHELQQANCRRVVVLPLYPQYSATTTASIFDAVSTELRQWRWLPELRFINHYHDDPRYIAALARSVQDYWTRHGQAQRLVMSFHGIPQAYFEAGDPYYCECQKTGRLLAKELGLADEQWQLTFQSRLGPKKWLQPYTDHTLKKLPSQGVKHVQLICPGFSADCLETLEEVAMENRAYFLEAGGETYEYIPCLNEAPDHVETLAALVEDHVVGWLPEEAQSPDALAKRLRRAEALGAKA